MSFLRLRVFWYTTGVLFFLTFLFYIVVFSSWLEIQEVKIQGAREISKERILFAVGENFWQGLFGIPTNSILLFDTKDMEEKLSFAFPTILNVTVERSLSRTLVVKVEERQQIGTWCPSLNTDEGSACFAVDIEGVAFKEVEEEGAYVVFNLKGEAVLGQELFAPSLLLSLLDFKERFQEAGESLQFSITAFEIGARGEVAGVSEEGWRILLNIKQDMEWQQTKLELVLQQKIPSEKRGKLEYIDLRFGDQAYIKYQD